MEEHNDQFEWIAIPVAEANKLIEKLNCVLEYVKTKPETSGSRKVRMMDYIEAAIKTLEDKGEGE